MAKKIVTAIDIGTHSIKVVQIAETRRGVSVLGLGSAPLADLAEAHEGKRKDAKMGILLHDLLSESGIRCKYAVTSIPGKRLFNRYVHVPPVPAWKLEALMKYEIEEENEESAGSVSYDFRLLDLPTKATEFTVMVAMAKNEVAEHCFEVLNEGGVRVLDVFPSATSLFNAYRSSYPGEVEDTSVVLNIGAESTDMVIQSYGRFFFTRSLADAGNAFTEVVQEEFEIPFEEAEKLKVERGRILPTEMHDELEEGQAVSEELRISDALCAAAGDLANAVQATLMFCRTQLKLPELKVDKLSICGGGAQLPGLAEYLHERLRYRVEHFNPFSALNSSRVRKGQQHYLEELPSGRFAAAAGLALTALERPHDVHLSLLAEKEKERRNFRITDKYLWYSAACLIAAIGVAMFTSYKMKDEMQGKRKEFEEIWEKAKTENADVKARLGAVGKQVDKVDAMLLRVNSSTEVFDLVKLLSDPKIVPDSVNLTELKAEDLDPLPLRKEKRDDTEESPAERVVKVLGEVRTVVPPPIDPEHKGGPPEPKKEDYQACLRIIEELSDNLMQVSDVVYKAYLTRADADPKLEALGRPLSFGINVELAPKTVTARHFAQELSGEAKN